MSLSLAITTSGNIIDNNGSVLVSYTGATTGSNWRVLIRVLVRGTQIASRDEASQNANAGFTVSYTASNVYTYAEGQSLTGAVTIEVTNYQNVPDGQEYVRSVVGNITINARLSSFSLTSPTTASPINMDSADPVNVIGSWTRPHTAFRGRIRLYVGNSSAGASTSWTLVSNRYGFTTSVNSDVVSLGLTSAIVNAMNSSSPKDFKVELQTQFRDGSGTNLDLSGTSGTRTANSGVIKNFIVLSTVSSTVSLSVHLSQVLSVTLTTQTSTYSHNVHLEFLTSGGSWSILATNALSSGTTSTSFTLTQSMVNSIASNYTTTTALTDKIRVRVQTYSANGQSGLLGETTKIGSATITNCAPSFTSTTVYVENVGGIIRTLTGGTLYLTTLLQNRSTATVTYGNIQTLKYATPVSYAIGFGTQITTSTGAGTAGTNGTYTVTGITQALTAAQLNYNSNQTVNITITDSRGLSATQQITFIILPYAVPNLRSASFYRSGGYTTDVRVDFSYDIQSIIVGGTERNGADADDMQRRIGAGGAWTNIAVAGATTVSGRIIYTQASVAVNTQALGDIVDYFLRYRDDVSTTHVTTSAYTVGKAIPSFQITENEAFVNGVKVLVEGQGGSGLSAYPVGAIYMSIVSTSPATLFGGTWVAMENQFLVGAGATFPAASTGGASTHTHTSAAHVHSVPAHSHPLSSNGRALVNMTTGYAYMKGSSATAWVASDRVTGTYSSSTVSNSWSAWLAGATDNSVAVDTGSTTPGATGSSSSLPPYLSVYMWRRSA